jgi:RNA polymerase sigma-70 factor (ECF subfamily)
MDTQTISDQKLIRSYLEGNEHSLESLINRHKKRVFGYVYHLVKDEELANDIFQDTFIKVINTLKRKAYNEEGKFLPWVMRIAHNLAVDSFRKAKKNPHTSGGENFDIFDTIKEEAPNAEQMMEDAQMRDDIRKLVEMLPDDQKQVLVMRHFAGMSFKDIAEETNVSINTALGRMRYALINLRRMIEENNLAISL